MLNILFFFCLSALIVGSVPLWRNVIKYKQATGELMPTRPNSESPLGFLDVIVMFFLWFVGQAVSIGLITFFWGNPIENPTSASGDTESWAAIVIAAGQLVATMIAVGIFLIRYGKPTVVGWQSKYFSRDLVVGLIAFVMVLPTILLLQWLLVLVMAYKHPTMELLAENANGLTLLATWFSAVLVAPICEELFFRGVLQSWLQRLGRGSSDFVLTGGWDSRSSSHASGLAKSLPNSQAKTSGSAFISSNPYESPNAPQEPLLNSDSNDVSWTTDAFWPILVTSALFGLAHAGQGPAPITLFLFGIALGYLFRKTGSIVPCIVLHMMLNGFSMFWFTLQVFLGDRATAMLGQLRSAFDVF